MTACGDLPHRNDAKSLDRCIKNALPKCCRTRLPLRNKKACGTSVWFLMGGLMPLLTMGVKENNCGVVLSLNKRRDTVGEPISTFLSRRFYIGFSRLLWVQGGLIRGAISGSSEFANSSSWRGLHHRRWKYNGYFQKNPTWARCSPWSIKTSIFRGVSVGFVRILSLGTINKRKFKVKVINLICLQNGHFVDNTVCLIFSHDET